MATLSKKSENVLANIVKKPHSFVKKNPESYLKKTPNDLEKLHPDFSQEGKEEMSVGHVGFFCQNLGITSYTLENYSNLKRNSDLTIAVFLKKIIKIEAGKM